MKIGLIGLQNSGKTTIFNALTGSEAEVSTYSAQKVEPHLAQVDVLDNRVDELSKLYSPKKTIYATVNFLDFAGLSSGSAKDGIFSGSSMGLIKTADALALVIRNFADEIITDLQGEPQPLQDLETITEELILSDLIIAENRIERIEKDSQRGRKTPESLAEQKVLKKILENLNESRAIRDIELTDVEKKTILGFQFLSQKPLLVILNSDENNYGKNQAVIDKLSAGNKVIEFAGNFEMELSRMEEDEAKLFMEDIGITESARERLTHFAYEMLGYISFFTVGEDEVRAWTIHNGESAVDAAGTIHSDLARGFIRAECFTCEDLLTYGSEKSVKEKGHFRLEGKDYIVKDGDILHIRFSV